MLEAEETQPVFFIIERVGSQANIWRSSSLRRVFPRQDVASQAAELLKLVDPGDFQLQAAFNRTAGFRSVVSARRSEAECSPICRVWTLPKALESSFLCEKGAGWHR